MMSAQEAKECFVCGTPGKSSRLMVSHLVEYKCPNCKTEWTTMSIQRMIMANKRRAEAQKRDAQRGLLREVVE